jgi:hypothetical protein
VALPAPEGERFRRGKPSGREMRWPSEYVAGRPGPGVGEGARPRPAPRGGSALRCAITALEGRTACQARMDGQGGVGNAGGPPPGRWRPGRRHRRAEGKGGRGTAMNAAARAARAGASPPKPGKGIASRSRRLCPAKAGFPAVHHSWPHGRPLIIATSWVHPYGYPGPGPRPNTFRIRLKPPVLRGGPRWALAPIRKGVGPRP